MEKKLPISLDIITILKQVGVDPDKFLLRSEQHGEVESFSSQENVQP